MSKIVLDTKNPPKTYSTTPIGITMEKDDTGDINIYAQGTDGVRIPLAYFSTRYTTDGKIRLHLRCIRGEAEDLFYLDDFGYFVA